jgi:type I restriction enzyme S subunit
VSGQQSVVSNQRSAEQNGCPLSWLNISLDNVVLYGKGKKPKTLSKKQINGMVPYIDIKAFEKGIIDEYADRESSKIIDEEDVLVVWDGARFGLTGFGMKGAAGSTLMVLKPLLINSKYLYFFINWHYNYINTHPKGTGTPHVNPDIFWNLDFPLAPFNEQKRITAKLDQIMPKIDGVKERLDRIPRVIKRFRQSVLTAAVTGKLTEKWREENPIIKSKIKVNEYGLLPETWTFNKFEEQILSIRGGTTIPPTNKKTQFPVLRSSSVRSGKIDYEDIKYIEAEKCLDEKSILTEGDLLFTRLSGSIDYVGNCAKVENLPSSNYLYPDRLFCAKLKNVEMADYIEMAFASAIVRKPLADSAKSSAGHQRISISDIKKTFLPLPPLKEQKEIVRQVDKLFTFADKLELHYKKAKAKIDKLPQSVLAKAFRGELVITEAELAEREGREFESAEQLLNRIKEEKARLEAEMKGRKKAARKRK